MKRDRTRLLLENVPEVMTIDELAEYLRLPQSALYQLIREGSIPGVQVSGHWRFHKESVDQWLATYAKAEDSADPVQPEAGALFYSQESFDISEHAKLVGEFDIRLNQLASGKFHSRVDCVVTPGMMIYEEYWRRKSEVCGATPEGYITLGTNAAWRRSEIQWCGTKVDHQRFACGKQGSDIDFIMPDQCHDVVMLVKPEILEKFLSQQAFDLLTTSKTIDFTSVAGQRLIVAITRIVRRFAKSPEGLGNPFMVRSLESELLETLSTCIADSNPDDRLRPPSGHRIYVRNALAYVEQSTEPLTVMDLARAAGVSQRTIDYAFQNILNMTPCAYLQRYRLNALHRDLKVADPSHSTITGIAQKWGFGHAGRLSNAYRKLFDELPSETLRKP